MDMLLPLLIGYLMGSIPFGLLLTRVAGAGDLRQVGSGNIGATNVLRTGHKGLAAATLLLDAGKGLAAVLVAAHAWPDNAGWAALGAVIGHCFPVWLKFRGGKGVATLIGITLGLAWPVGVICAAVWAGVLIIFRISSVGGISAAVAAPFAAMATGHDESLPVLTVLALLVVFNHRGNIARIRAGTEPKVGKRARS